MKKTRLYNIFLPIWMLILFPQIMPIIIILNGIWDFLIMTLTRKIKKIPQSEKPVKSWLIVVLFGFLADIITAVITMGIFILLSYHDTGFLGKILNGLTGLYVTAESFVVIIPMLLLAMFLIYIFNYKFNFKDYSSEHRKIMSLSLAVFTAPYTMFLPIYAIMNYFNIAY